MRFDFYQLTRDPAATVAVVLAEKIVASGGRLLIVGESEEQLRAMSDALWNAHPTSFLANALAGESGVDRGVQPILLSTTTESANGAQNLVLADGRWRDPPPGIDRLFYLFSSAEIDEARNAWRALNDHEGCTRHFWEQDDGRWKERG